MTFSKMTRRDTLLFASAITASQCLGSNSATPSQKPPDENPAPNGGPPLNRILFAGNPWPNGHAIKELVWSARLDANTGLWFDLHLESEEYDADDKDEKQPAKPESEPASDWGSKVVWNNYNRCLLSSTRWEQRGFLAATKVRRLDFASLGDREFHLDPLPAPAEGFDRAFGIYLLGHDGAADHHIRFTPQDSGSTYLLDWRGKIAMEYVGSKDFKRTFHARFDHLTFSGVRVPDDMSEEDARTLLKTLVDNLGELTAIREDDELWLKPEERSKAK